MVKKPGVTLTLSDEAADKVFKSMLLYWKRVLRPVKGRWHHPEDVKLNKERLAAIKVLLDFLK